MIATARDLRFRCKELLESVRRGEEVVITFRGKPCAKLIPFQPEKTPKNDEVKSPLFGMWKDHQRSSNVDEYVRNLRKGRF